MLLMIGHSRLVRRLLEHGALAALFEANLPEPEHLLPVSLLAGKPARIPLGPAYRLIEGQRVEEVDLDFGQGVVKRLLVPVEKGMGFNVGVLWDDPSLGGPSWQQAGRGG